jgi:hypothetical protein
MLNSFKIHVYFEKVHAKVAKILMQRAQRFEDNNRRDIIKKLPGFLEINCALCGA